MFFGKNGRFLLFLENFEGHFDMNLIELLIKSLFLENQDFMNRIKNRLQQAIPACIIYYQMLFYFQSILMQSHNPPLKIRLQNLFVK